MANIFRTEPALIIGVVTSLLAVLAAFGVNITEVQSDAIVALVAAVLILGGAIVTRQVVTPNAKVAARRETDGTVVSGPADNVSPDGTEVDVVPALDPLDAQE